MTTATLTVGWRDVAERLHAAHAAPLPGAVVREAKRSLFNVLGVALGASGTPQVERLLAHAARSAGPSPDTPSRIPGRAEWADTYHAALTTGFAAHLDDYDDTHLATVIHPGAACLGALWALPHAATGVKTLSAFALGCEAQLRLGTAVTPAHYDRGWHITGTCGVIGAAVTAALAGEAPLERLALAVRLAAAQTVGHREGFGTEVKPLHAGKAAANGLLAAATADLWAEHETGIDLGESMTPFLGALADHHAANLLVDSFGSQWELLANTYKPYPCGIVAHPGIDAAIDLARGQGVSPEEIATVVYECHPLVPELMGNTDPVTGLQARFSAIHGVAAGLLAGEVGLPEFADEAAVAPDLRAIRRKITMRPNDRLGRDQATVTVTLTSGESRVASVREARGSLRRPLTDEELVAKVDRLLTSLPVTGGDLWEAVDRIDTPDGWTALRDIVTPKGGGDG